MAGRTARERAERESRRRSRAYALRQAVFADRVRRRRRDDLIAGIVFVVLITAATLAQVGFFTIGPGAPKPLPSVSASPTATPTPSATGTPPPKSLSENRTWTGTATIGTTKLRIRLDGRKAPQAVANFVALAKAGFYSGSTCPRVTTPASGLSVLQCGSPADGSGGPGYTFGPLENVPKDGVYDRGVLAMARGTAEDSQGSQFFIVYGSSTLQAPGYTVFGEVTGGLATLRSAVISKGTSESDGDGPPKSPVTVRSVTVR